MSAQQQTLNLIREITSDGRVSFDELTQLATFLNENREARKTWPGSAVFDVLRDILRDGRVDPCELEGLNLILEGVEIICSGSARRAAETAPEPAGQAEKAVEKPEGAAGETPPDAAEEPAAEVDEESTIINLPVATDLRFPALLTDDIRHEYEGVHLPSYTCTCEDWQKNRAAFPEKCPGRACRCIVNALVHELDENPALLGNAPSILEEVLRAAAGSGRGLEAVGRWKRVRIAKRQFVISVGRTAWCNVYAHSLDNAIEKFSYHRDYKRWGFGDEPKDAGLLKTFFAEAFDSVFQSG